MPARADQRQMQTDARWPGESSTATIAGMNAVIENILEAAGIGKRKYPLRLLLSLLVSLAFHGMLLSSAGSVRAPGGAGTSPPRSIPQAFAYVHLALSPEAAEPAAAQPVLIARSQVQPPSAEAPGLVPVATPDELYFRAKDLEARPSPIGSLAFSPPMMGAVAKTVELKIRVFVNESGGVDFVRVEGDSPGSDFTDPVINTLKRSRFSPGQLNGENVKSQLVLGWKFVTESNE